MAPRERILAPIFLVGLVWAAPMALAQDATGSGPVRQQAQANWDQQAEQAFGLGRGQGRQLMTQEEWQEHQQKMQTMSVEDRERYRQEVHERMSQRAREKGISPSERPQPRGPMGGPGTGGSGRTGGSGMGGRSSGGRRGR